MPEVYFDGASLMHSAYKNLSSGTVVVIKKKKSNEKHGLSRKCSLLRPIAIHGDSLEYGSSLLPRDNGLETRRCNWASFGLKGVSGRFAERKEMSKKKRKVVR